MAMYELPPQRHLDEAVPLATADPEQTIAQLSPEMRQMVAMRMLQRESALPLGTSSLEAECNLNYGYLNSINVSLAQYNGALDDFRGIGRTDRAEGATFQGYYPMPTCLNPLTGKMEPHITYAYTSSWSYYDPEYFKVSEIEIQAARYGIFGISQDWTSFCRAEQVVKYLDAHSQGRQILADNGFYSRRFAEGRIAPVVRPAYEDYAHRAAADIRQRREAEQNDRNLMLTRRMSEVIRAHHDAQRVRYDPRDATDWAQLHTGRICLDLGHRVLEYTEGIWGRVTRPAAGPVSFRLVVAGDFGSGYDLDGADSRVYYWKEDGPCIRQEYQDGSLFQSVPALAEMEDLHQKVVLQGQTGRSTRNPVRNAL